MRAQGPAGSVQGRVVRAGESARGGEGRGGDRPPGGLREEPPSVSDSQVLLPTRVPPHGLGPRPGQAEGSLPQPDKGI